MFLLFMGCRKFQGLRQRIDTKSVAAKAILFDKATESQCPAQPIDSTKCLDTITNSIAFNFRQRNTLDKCHFGQQVLHSSKRFHRVDATDLEIDQFEPRIATDCKFFREQVTDKINDQFRLAVPAALLVTEIETPPVSLARCRADSADQYPVCFIALGRA